MIPFKVLGVDPGYASCGWAVLEVRQRGEAPLALGVVHTSQDDAEVETRARVRRSTEVVSRLWCEARERGVRWVVSEDTGFVPDAGALIKVALVIGGVIRVAHELGVGCTLVAPADVKRALRVEGKEAAAEAALRAYPGARKLAEEVKPGLRSHALDALAVVRAAVASDTPIGALVRNMRNLQARRAAVSTVPSPRRRVG